jgi:DNA repair exonuclease SbcCD ATPase subunit
MRQRRAERLTHEDKLRDLKATRAALGLVDGSVQPEIQKLSGELAQIDAEHQRARDDISAAGLPDAGAIEARRRELAALRTGLKTEAGRIDGELAAHNASLTRLAAERAALEAQSREIETQLRSDLTHLPDDGRDQALAAAARDHDLRAADLHARAALLARKRESAPDAGDVDRLRARHDRLVAALNNQASAIDRLNREIAGLEGQIKALGGDGLGEKAATLRLEHDMALAELTRQTERVAVLDLLRKTVEDAYDKRREQLNAPLRRHLKPFLHDVFPQAEIGLGEEFKVMDLKRSGPAAELFGRLSSGTQEQIAVLVRLAMGAMIGETGRSVPIILDDALVFSDDERIEQMFDAISRAGRNQQVIVLTCRARSFASLGGHQLRIS